VRTYTLTHLADDVLLGDLAALVARDRATTASLLAYIAEVDARRLYRPAGYSSMYAYCVEHLRLSEDAAYKRIQASRAARQIPSLFAALADGRLHLTAVCLLAPHLTPENSDALIAEATHQTRAGIELVLARRFPRVEALRLDEGISALPRAADGRVAVEPAPGQVAVELAPGQVPARETATQLAPGQVRAPAPVPPTTLKPLSPQRFALQVTIAGSTHDKLRYAQTLLSHSIPSGDVALVLDHALDALIGQLEKRKFASTASARRAARPARARRSIPGHVRRAVWERDGGRCTFVGERGHRCAAQRFLEFDHVDPVARGGRATVDRIRLRCRAHNQFEAERAFGAKFMREKREQAHLTAAAGRTRHTAARADKAAGREERTRDAITRVSPANAPTHQRSP
jgi:hypothetical protein